MLDELGVEYIKSEGNFIAIKTNVNNRNLFQNLMKDLSHYQTYRFI